MDEHETVPLFPTEGHGEVVEETGDVVLAQARSLLHQLEYELTEVERAVTRLEEGSYGRCDVCGSEVDPSRLAEDPTAHRCSQHQAPANA